MIWKRPCRRWSPLPMNLKSLPMSCKSPPMSWKSVTRTTGLDDGDVIDHVLLPDVHKQGLVLVGVLPCVN